MGDGNIGMADYIRTYVARCPGAAVSLEVIVQPTNWRIFDYRDPQAWEIFRSTPAWEFARFLALADRGAPRPLPEPQAGRGRGGAGQGGRAGPGTAGRAAGAAEGRGGAAGPQPAPAGRGRGRGSSPEAQQRNLEDVEASLRWTQQTLAAL
jgi:hypothetical protein